MDTTLTVNETVKESIMIALVRLLEKKRMDEISIMEIARVAGVNRSSFYRNFESKEQVLVAYINHIYRRFFDTNEVLREVKTQQDVYVFCLPRFRFIREHKEFFIALQKNYLLGYVFEQMDVPLLLYMNGLTEPVKGYYFAGVIGSCVGIIHAWIKDDFRRPEEDIVREFVASKCFLRGKE